MYVDHTCLLTSACGNQAGKHCAGIIGRALPSERSDRKNPASRLSTATFLGTIFLGPSILQSSSVACLSPSFSILKPFFLLDLILSYPKVKCFFAVGNNFTFNPFLQFEFQLVSIYIAKYYYFQ